MLHKYHLLSTAFSENDQKMSVKNGGKGGLLVVNELGLSGCDHNEFGLGDYLETLSPLGSSSKKNLYPKPKELSSLTILVISLKDFTDWLKETSSL
jgi:hypothetical protein